MQSIEAAVFCYYFVTARKFVKSLSKEDSGFAKRDPYTISMHVLIFMGLFFTVGFVLPTDVYYLFEVAPYNTSDFPYYLQAGYDSYTVT